jgi:glyoxylase-like metal-dependent hydrolase (beta-lactamase superfamily II)
MMFSGDLLFAGSIGRTDLPGGDYPTILDSLARVCLTLPDDVQVLPGHGPGTTIGAERASNPFLAGLAPRPPVPPGAAQPETASPETASPETSAPGTVPPAVPAAPPGRPGRGRPGL